MPSERSIATAAWLKLHPEKKREYYLRSNPHRRRLEVLKAEALARTEKACTGCRIVRPMEEFVKSRKSRDGRASQCLECMRKRTAAWKLVSKAKREALHPKEVFPDGHKRCGKCGVLKPYEDFPKRKTLTCKQCACEYAKATYRKDPEKSYAYHIQWCKDHPEEIKQLRRDAYRRSHPNQKTIEQVKAEKLAKADRTEKACKKCKKVKPIEEFGLSKKTADGRQYQCLTCFAEHGRARYASNPKILEYRKQWVKINPEGQKNQNHKRRALKKGIPGSHTVEQWKALCKKFKNRCVCCGKSGKLTRDHIVPITNSNSSNDISNIQPLCYSCNSSKNNRFSVDYRKTPFIKAGQNLLFA